MNFNIHVIILNYDITKFVSDSTSDLVEYKMQ